MQELVRRTVATVGMIGAAALAPQAHATSSVVIDFEPSSLTNLYFNGDSFTQNGFTMTVDFDAGIVDTALALGGAAPSGNATQFYTQLNEGGLIVERTGGGLFDLTSFDAAFVPLSPPAAGTTVMVAVGVYGDDSTTGVAWLFEPSSTSSYPFAHYADPADFAAFSQVKLVEFFACSFDGANVCAGALANNGQFAIDNITANVPEPTTAVMLTMGLLGLALRRRSPR